MTQRRYMLIFAIGPVQSLIAQARKTRDLWLGSYLLAKLMEAAMQGIDREKLVFPANPTVEKAIADLPNKYLALLDPGEDAKTVADQSISHCQKLWEAIQVQVKARVFYKSSIHTAEDDQERDRIWDQQTRFESFFEVYWVAVPKPTDDELKEEQARPGNAGKTHYQFWLEKALAAFDARKRLHDFQQQPESGEKSTVSGEREALHGMGTTRQEIRNYWRALASTHPAKDIYRDGSERLDAIDTIKRFALYARDLQPKDPETQQLEKMDFPSTSSIATASFVKLLLKKSEMGQNADLKDALEEWLTLTENGGLAEMQPHAIPYLYQLTGNNKERQKILRRDGDCFFDETFVPETLQKEYRDAKVNFAEATRVLRTLREAAGASPTAYYALIQMDGDHIGSIINGVKEQLPHQNISKALSDFARQQAPEIVEQKGHPGKLVYAGGDDMIAFSPLVGLLSTVKALQLRYRQALGGMAPAGKKVSASTGIAIAHHTTPLALVRRAASEAEELAKERYGRNALVVTIMRRSGEQTRVGCHWEYGDLKPEEQPLALFGEFYRLLINGQLSESSIHALLDEVPALIGLRLEARQSEIKRILQRKQHYQNDPADESGMVLPDAKARELAERVVHLAAAMDKAMDEEQADDKDATRAFELEVDTLRVGLVEVFGWLLVMAFLAREEHHLDMDARERGNVQ